MLLVVAALPLTVNVAAWRAYALPDSSVPPCASPGLDVNSPIYQDVGRVTDDALNAQFNMYVSYVLEKLMIAL
tara:strand:- start:123 stop:341 length:219 start_codon:yes stop_codon:yes gene_type:complete